MKQTTIQLFYSVILQVTKAYFHPRRKLKPKESVFLIKCSGKIKYMSMKKKFKALKYYSTCMK